MVKRKYQKYIKNSGQGLKKKNYLISDW